MQKELDTFKSLGATIVVVVRDDAKAVKEYWKENKLSYIGIPDDDKKLGELYKQKWNLIKLGLMPALFVVDTKGTIQFSHYSSSMKDIPENTTIFEILKSMKVAPKKEP